MPRCKKNKGFNLVEAAIVLGVIGLVIGGIWVAASRVSRNTNLNSTVQLVALTYNNLSRLYSQHKPSVYTAINQPNLMREISGNAQISGANIKDTLGGSFYIYLIPQAIAFNFILPTDGTALAYCRELANKLSSTFRHLSPQAYMQSTFSLPGNVMGGASEADLSTPAAADVNCVGEDGIVLFLSY